MKVLPKIILQEDVYHKTFNDFIKRCMTSHTELTGAKKDFMQVKDLFVRGHQLEDFCDRTTQLSEQLKSNGKQTLSDLLINELGKLCLSFRLNDNAEKFLNMSIENFRAKKDGLHELARLTDLEYMYKFTRNRRGIFDILNRKKECCKRIINNYEENVENFQSLHIKPASKSNVQIQLAFAYSDIAKMIERKKPDNAIILYEKAKKIYEDLGRKKEIAYLEEKLRRMRTYR